jgi:hypothetical protein
MKSTNALALFGSLFLLQSCGFSGHRSTLDDEKIAYAITKEQAVQIVDASIRAYISPDYITGSSEDGLTKTGYFRMMLDTQTMTASAIPAQGIDSEGVMRRGYGFAMADVGSIIGLRTPKQIYDQMKSRASHAGETLKTQ